LDIRARTLPFKFLLVFNQLETPFTAHRFWKFKEAPQAGARRGAIERRGTKSLRVDIDQAYFKHDATHWCRRNLRRMMKRRFKGARINQLPADSVVVMIWTNDLLWLNHNEVRTAMLEWDGRTKEVDDVWNEVTGGPKW
jgi:hypothetical protein